MSEIAKIIGERLRTIRKEQGLSQESLAERAELHNTYISQVERGEKNLTLETLEKILIALDVTFEDVFHLLQPSRGNRDTSTINTIVVRLNSLTASEQSDVLSVIETMLKWKRE